MKAKIDGLKSVHVLNFKASSIGYVFSIDKIVKANVTLAFSGLVSHQDSRQ